MKRSYKRRPTDFKRRIIARISSGPKDLLAEEQRWLSLIKPEELRNRYYNLQTHSGNHWAASASSERKKSISQKISERTKAAMQSSDIQKRYKEGIKNRRRPHDDPGYREQIRQTCLSKNLNKGMMTVRYPNDTKCFQVSTDDPRWLNGELVTHAGYKKSKRIRKKIR